MFAARLLGISPLAITGDERCLPHCGPPLRTAYQPPARSHTAMTTHRHLPSTGYEQRPGSPIGFETYAFQTVHMRVITVPKSVAWAHAMGRDPPRGAARQAFRGVMELSGRSREAPGTLHHQLVLNGLVTSGAAGKHRFLCAGGDGYDLVESRMMRRWGGIYEASEIVSSVEMTISHGLLGDETFAAAATSEVRV